MNLFRQMITDNTKALDINYHLVSQEEMKKSGIVPNCISSNTTNYLNWFLYNGELYHYKMFNLNDFICDKYQLDLNSELKGIYKDEEMDTNRRIKSLIK